MMVRKKVSLRGVGLGKIIDFYIHYIYFNSFYSAINFSKFIQVV